MDPTTPSGRRDGSRGERAKAVLRATAMCAILGAGIGLFTAGRAKAEAGEASLRLGQSLSGLSDMIGRSSDLRVNGNRIFAGATHVNLEFKEVLDRFEKHCNEHAWDVNDDMEAVLAGIKLKALASGRGAAALSPSASPSLLAAGEQVPASLTLSRSESDTEGAVVCLAPAQRMKSAGLFLDRARTALETGELSQVGDLRYAFARKDSGGGSTLITVWTDGDFNFFRLFPQQGDAPGDDLADVPRPPGSKRVLHAELAGSPYAVRAYTTEARAGDVLAAYDDKLGSNGWQSIKDSGAFERDSLRTFIKQSAAVMIVASREGRETRVNVVQVAALGNAANGGRRAQSSR